MPRNSVHRCLSNEIHTQCVGNRLSKKLRINIQNGLPFNIKFSTFLTPRLSHIDCSVSYCYLEVLFEDAGLCKIIVNEQILHHLGNGLCERLVHQPNKILENDTCNTNVGSSEHLSKKHIFTYNTPSSEFSKPEVVYKCHYKEISQEAFEQFCNAPLADDSVSAHYTKRDFENSQSYTIDIYNNESSQAFKVDPSHLRI